MPTKIQKCNSDLHWHECSARHVELCKDSEIANKYSGDIIGTPATSSKQGYAWYVYDKSGELIASGFEQDEKTAVTLANQAMV